MPQAIKVGDRWAVVGATGSGKTVFSRALLKIYYRATAGRVPIMILDSKITGDFEEFAKSKLTKVVRGNDPKEVVKHLFSGKFAFVIWQPEEDDTDMYDEYFKLVYQSARGKKRTSCISFIDELSSICSQSGKAPRYYDILQKQGRALHLGIISCTQSPSFIPQNLLRQATHMIRFGLNDEYDSQKLARVMGREVLAPPTDRYGFWYRDCSRPAAINPPQYFTDYKHFIGA